MKRNVYYWESIDFSKPKILTSYIYWEHWNIQW